jgi:hypothetical protein
MSLVTHEKWMRWYVGVPNYIEVGNVGLYEIRYGNDH